MASKLRPVWVLPGRQSRRQLFAWRGSIIKLEHHRNHRMACISSLILPYVLYLFWKKKKEKETKFGFRYIWPAFVLGDKWCFLASVNFNFIIHPVFVIWTVYATVLPGRLTVIDSAVSERFPVINWAVTWQNQQSECAPSEDSGQPGRQPRLISLRCVLNGYLRTQCFFMRTATTLIRLGGCPGWSESLLCTQVSLLVLSHCGYFFLVWLSSRVYFIQPTYQPREMSECPPPQSVPFQYTSCRKNKALFWRPIDRWLACYFILNNLRRH